MTAIMFTLRSLIILACFAGNVALASIQHHDAHDQHVFPSNEEATDWLPYDIRAFWMRRANEALLSPCPFEAFGTVIVNHTRPNDIGDLICIGANNIQSGNPTLHGEIAGINNCSAVLTDPQGHWKYTPAEAAAAFHDLTLYTNAEPCPMCAAAIRWAGFRELVYGTSIPALIAKSWPQMRLRASEVFDQSKDLQHKTRLIENVLSNETDPYFAWQFDEESACPPGCSRVNNDLGRCSPSLKD